ncbi:hypothetical protein C8D88_104160 [Lentzea atacamensis]|uniref:Uncharacterized protein n=1 Tax=Lentzea atacamensis TaxID=531938 RepID=A0A316IIH9_9PSEU|nr:hypothetical protein C8D88_104160 [Lentzea atacamensis]
MTSLSLVISALVLLAVCRSRDWSADLGFGDGVGRHEVLIHQAIARMSLGAAIDRGHGSGLLALMLLTDARREAWADGTGPAGEDQLQAAIDAVHDEAPTAAATDWPQILAVYNVLAQVAPGPMVTLGHAVAVAEVHGPRAGLAVLGTLEADERMAHSHRLEAVRAHLLERAGDLAAAVESYGRAARMTASLPEQQYLMLRAARVARTLTGRRLGELSCVTPTGCSGTEPS